MPVHDETDNFDRGENYKQDFEAPFYPSVNIDRPQNPARNSWAIVTPPSAVYSNGNRLNAIDRSDNNVSDEPSTSVEQNRPETNQMSNSTPSTVVVHSVETTQSFDPDKFQPDFQGGFKPIYPPSTTPKATETKLIDAKSTNLDAEDSIESLISDFLSGEDPESTTSN